ncbi:hypothetical protein EVJ30_12900 [Exiguobacterium sp. SH5S13]|uniref:Cap15 family cyclic dinucleotide receptor domain-containing protein n=1 Tax=Exiguobacterium sp. SH5S13 TaxID=2510959 RepID=UPI001038BF04|nr:hypothetical protein [Exiguobacterium sp. SH5S13]TCI50343.1 hypothetical protein EVJ30_12900 [Exiguobacterium sp. SH5S13]
MYNRNLYYKIWFIIGGAISFILVLLKGISINFKDLVPLLGILFTASGITLVFEQLVFKRILWIKKPHWFYSWLCPIPYLGGEWTGELISSYTNPETEKEIAPIKAKLKIIHKFDCIEVRMDTENIHSVSVVSDILVVNDETKYLYYTYRAEPDYDRGQNRIHEGTVKLRIEFDKNKKTILNGTYFTNRETIGKMRFQKTT